MNSITRSQFGGGDVVSPPAGGAVFSTAGAVVASTAVLVVGAVAAGVGAATLPSSDPCSTQPSVYATCTDDGAGHVIIHCIGE